jgi:hypothetical protein
METRGNRQEFAWQVLGVILSLSAVTAASYLWGIVQDKDQIVVVITYALSLILMTSLAWIIFRRVVRKDYEKKISISLHCHSFCKP